MLGLFHGKSQSKIDPMTPMVPRRTARWRCRFDSFASSARWRSQRGRRNVGGAWLELFGGQSDVAMEGLAGKIT